MQKNLKPFLKWAGGKSKLLNTLKIYYPFKKHGHEIKKYAEIFLGGGAVLFDVLNNYELDEIFISDLNPALMNAYKIIRDKIDALIFELYNLKNLYCENRDDNIYYSLRAEFNDLVLEKNFNVRTAALMIFLNKTCYNGLYRVNSKGAFNVPKGNYKNPAIFDAENLLNISLALKNSEIECCDFKEAENFIDSYTFVYIDPPYRIINNNFTAYTDKNFDEHEQLRLAAFVNELSKSGAYILASNSDSDDNFFEKNYSGMKIINVKSKRMIACKNSSRIQAEELIMLNYEP